MNLFSRNAITALLLTLATSVSAGKHKPGLAVVIDSGSMQQARTEVEGYVKALEDIQGFHVYTVVDQWGVPDSIRDVLRQLHSLKSDPIVGAVLIGDIPVPMIRDAQHLTSAFKMNQGMDWKQSSVPSDRFYDDFGLTFRYLQRDSTEASLFYYSLTGDGDQTLRPDIFSGRIRPTDTGDSDRYMKLRLYLRKATEAKKNPEPLRRLLVFTGSGSLNESKVAHTDEVRAMYDHFPQLRNEPHALSCLDYADDTIVKPRLMNELMRPDLSLSVLHHHGDYDTQYLAPDGHDSVSMRKARLTLPDFAGYNFRPNCRVMLYDACYNGAFQREDCIANEYIFQPGKAIAGIGGTVNVLQDKWPDKLAGLLANGVMVGYLNMLNIDLETHVVGDTTFCFAADEEVVWNKEDIKSVSPSVWKKVLRRNTAPDQRVLAMEMLRDDTLSLTNDQLMKCLKTAVAGTERLQAFKILLYRRPSHLQAAMLVAAADNYELLQRLAVNALRDNGSRQSMRKMAEVIASNNTSTRVLFNAMQGVQFFPDSAFMADLSSAIDSVSRYVVCDSTYRQTRTDKAGRFCGRWDEDVNKLCNGQLSEKRALLQANFMRIYLPSYLLEDVVRYTETCQDMTLRKDLLEALGWHRLAYNSGVARESALRQSTDMSLPEEVRHEALKTYKRLK